MTQKDILRWAWKKEKFTKQEAVAEFGHNYHCNAAHHIGEILSRMVKGGKLKRLKAGTFALNIDTHQKEQLKLL